MFESGSTCAPIGRSSTFRRPGRSASSPPSLIDRDGVLPLGFSAVPPPSPMGKKPSGKARGAPPKVIGSKLAYLNALKPGYFAAAAPHPGSTAWDTKRNVGKFYDGVTNLLIHKYGHDFSLTTNPDVNPPDPDRDMASVIPKDPTWSEEERSAFDKNWQTLREVRSRPLIDNASLTDS